MFIPEPIPSLDQFVNLSSLSSLDKDAQILELNKVLFFEYKIHDYLITSYDRLAKSLRRINTLWATDLGLDGQDLDRTINAQFFGE